MPASARSSLRLALAFLSISTAARSVEAQIGSVDGYVVETGLFQRTFVRPAFTDAFAGMLLPSERGFPSERDPISERDRLDWGPRPPPYALADSAESAATLFAGQRSLAGGAFRHLARTGVGSSVVASGYYARGDDWSFADSVEVRLRERSALLPQRDNQMERWGAQVLYALRQGDTADWVFAAGLDRQRGNRITEVGAAHAGGWTGWYGRTRYRRGRLIGEATVGGRGAEEAVFYRTARGIEDQSLVFAGRLRHSTDLGPRQSLDYGVDVRNTLPHTNGSVTGVYEDADGIRVAGGYLNSRTSLSSALDLEAALRVESHSRVEGLNLSPRADLVFRPAVGHGLRASFGRVLSSPTTDNFVMDVTAGRMNAGALIYDLLARGVPASGFTFNDRCPGGYQDLCMRSPLAPGEKLPADPSVLWNLLVDIAAATDPLALRPLRVFFRNPEPGELRPRLLLYSQKESEAGRPPFLGEGALGRAIDVRPVDPLQPTTVSTLALGYQGEAADRGRISAEIWRSSVDNFIGPLRAETPTVFFDPASVRAFMERRAVPMVRLGILPPELVELMVYDLTNLVSQIPVGTIMPDQVTTPGLLLTYRNYGKVELWGANLSAEISLTPALLLRGAYSYVSEECFDFAANAATDCSDLEDISLNLPKTRGSFSFRYRNPDSGFSGEARLRRLRGFYANAGIYAGVIEGYAVLDAEIRFPIPRLSRTSLGIAATNLLDDRHQEFIGAPEIGRLVMAKLTYAFR